ncbi:hypothetical protein L345_15799 [Ophiophagus hannah]|uniref:Uncharacterized protein n=1 Tax=Ophiophagus hannah TaxID=8665 RepID=V8N8R9_OPHHA|nr:hypothetical protein L345_15799 [Ophiophagus hannah]
MRCSSLSEMRRPSPEGHNGMTPLGSVSSLRLKSASSTSDNSSVSPESFFSGVSSLGEVRMATMENVTGLGFESSVQPKEHQHHMTEEGPGATSAQPDHM